MSQLSTLSNKTRKCLVNVKLMLKFYCIRVLPQSHLSQPLTRNKTSPFKSTTTASGLIAQMIPSLPCRRPQIIVTLALRALLRRHWLITALRQTPFHIRPIVRLNRKDARPETRQLSCQPGTVLHVQITIRLRRKIEFNLPTGGCRIDGEVGDCC